jgi:hypothetical protein
VCGNRFFSNQLLAAGKDCGIPTWLALTLQSSEVVPSYVKIKEKLNMQTDYKALQMTRGLHIYVLAMKGLYEHHGISCGDGTVIHHPGGLHTKSNSAISRTSIVNFGNGRDIFIFPHTTGDPPNVVVERAESKVGEAGYNLFNNNCEHFAVWCKTGIKECYQIKDIRESSLLMSGLLLLPGLAMPLPLAFTLTSVLSATIKSLQFSMQSSHCDYDSDKRIFTVKSFNNPPSILKLN